MSGSLAMTDRKWHYALRGGSVGPLTSNQIQALIDRGLIAERTLVWSEGMPQWAEAAATDLGRYVVGSAATPPPVPPTAAPEALSPGGPAPRMGFVESVRYCLTNYVKFSGRGSRSQYWFFQLFIWTILLSVLVLFFLVGGPDETMRVTGEITLLAWTFIGILGLFYLGLLMPAFAALSRRLHDAGWSYWWMLAGVVPYVGGFLILAMTLLRDPQPNRFDAP